jgi:hypothetical protein
MPTNPAVLTYVKSVSVALFAVVTATLGVLAVGVFGDYFETYPVHTTIMLTQLFGIDVLGALIPLAIACLSAVVFSKLTKSPLRKLAVAFPLSVLLAFVLCHQTADGVAGLPLLYAFLASVIAAGVTLNTKPRNGLKASITIMLALTMFCVPLSIFTVDLAYAPSFSAAVIGGAGLTDGILLATLYAPLTLAIVYSALTYISVTFNLVKINQAAEKLKSPKTFRTVTPDKSTGKASA